MTTKHHWHKLETAEVVSLLETNILTGLTSEAVVRKQQEFGPNRIDTYRPVPHWKRFALQFHNPIAYILLVASLAMAVIGQFVDAAVIFAVIFVNCLFGFFQELKAENALQALSQLVESKATVLRDGRRSEISAAELVPGDVILLHSGDQVPADVRLIKVHNLQVDESLLTGESVAVHKHTDPLDLDTVLADRKNLCFAGTYVTTGQAQGLVWAIGNQTEMGRIAWLISEVTELATPLTRKLAQFSRLLLKGILVLSLVTFVVGMLRGENAVEMFMAAVALAVGAIPEGLPAAVTIVLAIGTSRMAKRRAIVRKLPAVETLGSTTVICTDKTGTLTKNQMTVVEVFAGNTTYLVTGSGYSPKGVIQLEGHDIVVNSHPQLLECLKAGMFCNDSTVSVVDGIYKIQGDPTEAAMAVAAQKAGLSADMVARVDMIPFESESMYRATLHESSEANVIYKVGALERILPRCQDMLDAGANIVPLDVKAIYEAQETMAAGGLRVLAFARRHVASDQKSLRHEHVAGGLTFLGLQGIIDPPRPEAMHAVVECQKAGIVVKMITGDHALTACAIAEQIGLEGLKKEGRLAVLTGSQLEKMTDDELFDAIEAVSVFARITPEQKLRLVQALHTKGHIIAMTGDGVNDAPALKQADIGVAMGLSGSDVAKGAADIVLTDDNFATIEAAVEEGRGVFDNLMKFLVWTLPTNLGEALILLVAIFLGLSLPCVPVQLLWVNMVTAIFLGTALAFEPKERDLMRRMPRSPKQPILTYELFMRSGLVALIMLAGAYWLFYWETYVEGYPLAIARTAVINVIVFVEVAYLFSCRSLVHSLLSIGVFSNKWALLGSSAMVCLQLFFTYEPTMNRLFYSAPLSVESWFRIGIVAVATFIVVEFEKWCRSHDFS